MLNSSDHQTIQKHIGKIIDFTKPYPMSRRLAFKIYKAYGSSSIERLTKNPYALSRDVFGIGEETATKIAKAVENKLGKTFSPKVVSRSNVPKYHYGGPGNGKLSPENFKILKRKLRAAPTEMLPDDWELNNPDFWTIPDLKRAICFWFDVRWAHDSSYRNIFKKCQFVYNRKKKVFILTSADPTSAAACPKSSPSQQNQNDNK